MCSSDLFPSHDKVGNVTEANANAQKAVELWNQEMLNTKYLDETQEERVTKLEIF